MKISAIFFTGFFFALGSSVQAREPSPNSLHVDCRYHLGQEHFCYSSASYEVDEEKVLRHIRFGVGCDHQTLYDNSGNDRMLFAAGVETVWPKKGVR